MLASNLYGAITCVWRKTTGIGELPRFEFRVRPIDRACPHHTAAPRKLPQAAAGALSPALLQKSAEKMSDKRRRKRLGSGDSEGSEDSEGSGGIGGEGKEEEKAGSDPERDEGVVSCFFGESRAMLSLFTPCLRP